MCIAVTMAVMEMNVTNQVSSLRDPLCHWYPGVTVGMTYVKTDAHLLPINLVYHINQQSWIFFQEILQEDCGLDINFSKELIPQIHTTPQPTAVGVCAWYISVMKHDGFGTKLHRPFMGISKPFEGHFAN